MRMMVSIGDCDTLGDMSRPDRHRSATSVWSVSCFISFTWDYGTLPLHTVPSANMFLHKQHSLLPCTMHSGRIPIEDRSAGPVCNEQARKPYRCDILTPCRFHIFMIRT